MSNSQSPWARRNWVFSRVNSASSTRLRPQFGRPPVQTDRSALLGSNGPVTARWRNFIRPVRYFEQTGKRPVRSDSAWKSAEAPAINCVQSIAKAAGLGKFRTLQLQPFEPYNLHCHSHHIAPGASHFCPELSPGQNWRWTIPCWLPAWDRASVFRWERPPSSRWPFRSRLARGMTCHRRGRERVSGSHQSPPFLSLSHSLSHNREPWERERERERGRVLTPRNHLSNFAVLNYSDWIGHLHFWA